MRALFVTWAWPSHFYPLAQLAWAFGASGHETAVASQPALTEVITQAGLPAVAVGRDLDIDAMVTRYFTWLVRQGRPVEWEEMRAWGTGNVVTFRRIAEAMIDETLDFARAWRPDLVVYDPTTFVGPLTAAVLGVPAVRHIWGIDYTYRTREFEPEALRDLSARLGLDDVETLGDVTVDPCPPTLQVPADVRRLTMRYAPYNGPAVMPGWLNRPPERPRVCVIGSSAVSSWGGRQTALVPQVVEAIADFDVEIVAIAPDEEREWLGPVPANVRLVGRTPLHLLLPGCALVIHQGGGGAVMTTLGAGLPQLIVPWFTDHVFNGRRVAEVGAGSQIFGADCTPALIREEVGNLLTRDAYPRTANRLRQEMAQAPAAADVVRELTEMARA
jgi:UDP:flavonoid glycosyltransferase YjiC (YdhE family)